jgi:lysozyme
MDQILLKQIERDEGKSNVPYQDSLGNWTIGYGHKLSDVEPGMKWLDAECVSHLVYDLTSSNEEVRTKLPWSVELDGPRLRVLQNMCFNMGIDGLLQFHNTLHLVQVGMYAEASVQMLKSLWAEQVGDRAVRLSDQMKTGIDK